MSNVVDTLIEMGFSKERAELAVSRTGNNDVQTAMDWLLSHEEELGPSESTPTPEEQQNTNISVSTEENATETVPEAVSIPKSIQCDDCGKLFKTNEEVEFHASKSGHKNFSESTEEKKPLTEEEKKEQLAKIEAKLRQRRLEREAREKEEALLREKNRIKSGKELLEAKKKYDELEMKKIVEQRKREKEEEKLARQRVREQIEQDKLARKTKFSGATKAEPVSLPVAEPTVVKTANNSYSEVKLQIRLPNGSALTQTFGAKEPLSAVRLYVEMNRQDADGPFNLMTNFPRKVFISDDYDKPLETLGLAPTATLFVQKS
ncbi:UBX domain-containing protein 1 [Anoplophora glabripennis]|nr:UBX domain-containing protein 1 [Anoplophora glabripennis]